MHPIVLGTLFIFWRKMLSYVRYRFPLLINQESIKLKGELYSLYESFRELCQKCSPLVMKITKNIWFIFTVIPFPNPCSQTYTEYFPNVKSKAKETVFCEKEYWGWYKNCTVNCIYAALLWKLQLRCFFLTMVTGTSWELCSTVPINHH